MRADTWMARAERALLTIAVVCLSWVGYVSIEAAQFQRDQGARFERLLTKTAVAETEVRIDDDDPAAAPSPSPVAAPAAILERLPTAASLVGILEIPRLALKTAVVSGDDAGTLRVAAGHLPDTPEPWEPGNSAIAAHRDGFFRPLRHVRLGDEVRLRTMRGELRYTVVNTKIVAPDDLSVLAPTPSDSLTLITCYPFNYVGAAPQRYIVRAERVR